MQWRGPAVFRGGWYEIVMQRKLSFRLLDGMDLHVLVHGEIRARRYGRRFALRCCREASCDRLHGISITIASRLLHGECAARIQLVQRSVRAVLGLIHALRLCNRK